MNHPMQKLMNLHHLALSNFRLVGMARTATLHHHLTQATLVLGLLRMANNRSNSLQRVTQVYFLLLPTLASVIARKEEGDIREGDRIIVQDLATLTLMAIQT